MMLEWIRFGLVAVCFAAGLVTLFVSILGTFRLSYSLNRIHAAAMCDTLVLILFIVGCVLASGVNVVSFKFIFILLMLWCTSPVASHILMKTRYMTDEHLSEHCEICTNDDGKGENDV